MGKLQGNTLWESSRMMIVEHVEALINYGEDLNKRGRIYLDDQEMEYISSLLQSSLQQRNVIKVKLYHPFEHTEVIGVVERIDRSIGRFKVDGEWFTLGDIEGVESDA